VFFLYQNEFIAFLKNGCRTWGKLRNSDRFFKMPPYYEDSRKLFDFENIVECGKSIGNNRFDCL